MDQHETETRTETGRQTELKGFGGWLLVFTIVVCLRVLFGLIAFTGTAWLVSKVPNVPIIWVSLVIGAILIFIGILILMTLYQRRQSGPKLIVTLLTISVCLAVISLVIALTSEYYGGPDDKPHVVPTVIALAENIAWLAYFRTSRRVKNTFINPHYS